MHSILLNAQSSVYNGIALLDHDDSLLQFHLQLKPKRCQRSYCVYQAQRYTSWS
jgi:hypothetical protein